MKNLKINKEVIQFLDESNKIEGVYDLDSLLQAAYAWNYLIEEDKLTPDVILKTHKILMLHQLLRPDAKGYFRKIQVEVGGREGARWEKVPELIRQWCENVNFKYFEGTRDSTNDEESIRQFHIEYERIHPFVDGNGRTGRIFYNWTRIKVGLPIHIIHAGEEQMNYYKWFKDLSQ